jgi:hypothetical protein
MSDFTVFPSTESMLRPLHHVVSSLLRGTCRKKNLLCLGDP